MKESFKMKPVYVVAFAIILGAICVAAGMFFTSVELTAKVSGVNRHIKLYLFDGTLWKEHSAGELSNVLPIVAVMITLAGSLVLLADFVLRTLMGVDLRLVRIGGIALAAGGAIFLLVMIEITTIKLNNMHSYTHVSSRGLGYEMGFGSIVILVGGLLSTIGGAMMLTNKFVEQPQ